MLINLLVLVSTSLLINPYIPTIYHNLTNNSRHSTNNRCTCYQQLPRHGNIEKRLYYC